MSKIRVFELAKDLNMTSKALLEKILDLKIEVKTHMSALDDKTIDLIKAHVSGKLNKDRVVEERVKSTVIRRRRRDAEQKAEEPLEEKTPDLEENVDATESPVESETTSADQVELAEEIPEETEEASSDTSTEDQKSDSDAAMEESGELAVAEIDATDEGIPPDVIQPEVEDMEVQAAGLPIEEEKKESPEEAQSSEKAVKPKKQKKFAAAKIIKLPEKPMTRASVLQEEDIAPKVLSKPTSEQEKAKAAEEEDARRKKKKKKIGAAPEEEDRNFFRKKISFKRKAVVEGTALYDEEDRARARKSRKSGKSKAPVLSKTHITMPKAIKRRIKIDENIILSDFAKRLGIKASEIIQKLISMGSMATVNQAIDFETATLLANEFGYEVEKAAFEEKTYFRAQEEDDPSQMTGRPPVVTIMGHVDHGKTSLLDVIRKTRVTDMEAGGITQHIGAYNVSTPKGQVVFLDTPGHEAFTSMRSRGARITDIVVLVVAADDGVMPQTIEAINHSKAAGVPIIVAVNKIDKAEADPERVKRELSDQGIVPEDWGGSSIFVHVSAKTKDGIGDLLDMILLQSEMLELKANPNKPANGHVIEAKLDSGRGPVASILIKEGTLHTGDSIVCGVHYGKIRAMLDDAGQNIDAAGPSIPVEILGLNGVPDAGDEMITINDEKSARQVSAHRLQKQRSIELAKNSRMSLEGLFEKLGEGEVKDLNLILKADVHGSIEALRDALNKLSTSEVKINIVHAATGTVSESDVSLATVSNAIIIGFNIRPGAKVQDMADEENVDMRFYDIIYNVIKDIKSAMVGLMDSKYEERILGRADVREVFVIPKKGVIAGSYVTDGKIERGRNIRVLREGVIVYDGRVGSLRRFKDDAKEVTVGYECGIGVENFNDIKTGDVLECYYLEEIKPELE